MRTKNVLLIAVMVCGLTCPMGCEKVRGIFTPKPKAEAAEPVAIPAHIEGTVGQHARLVGGGELSVQGYGIVIGLGDNGSKEVPSHLRVYLLQQLGKYKVGSWVPGEGRILPERVLRDPDTAIVMVAGTIPPGAPKGTRFDLMVTALQQTATRSLDGGILMPLDLRLAAGGLAKPGGPSKPLAGGSGAVFVNPFLDPGKSADMVKFRQGRLPGGGKSLHDRPIMLRLRKPDYALCSLIERKINGQFPFRAAQRIANAQNRQLIRITIPGRYRDDYEHFLDLITHLPLRDGPGQSKAHARKIAKAMETPTADHDGLALVWEASGRQVLPFVRPLYNSKNSRALFYSARAGLRLGDDLAGKVVARFAATGGWPLQIPAIRELGRHPQIPHGGQILARLIDQKDELVRIAAYEAMVQRGGATGITRISMGEDLFTLDIVPSHRSYVVYATQSGRPGIVLFGKDMTVNRPVFYQAPGELVVINANSDKDKLTVRRKIPRSGRSSESVEVDQYVRSVVQLLGSPPPAKPGLEVKGLGLTYSQVVSVLHGLCQNGGIRAKFVLQEMPGTQSMYDTAAGGGRPDTPDS